MDILTQVKLLTGKMDEALINLLIEKTKAEVVLICKCDYIVLATYFCPKTHGKFCPRYAEHCFQNMLGQAPGV